MAPRSIPIQSPIGGCGAFPNDSILNTRIDTLPVHAKSANWLSQIVGYRLGVEPGFVHNVVPTVPSFQTMKFSYGGGGSFPIPAFPNRKREGGTLKSASDGGDHHQFTVLTGANQCQFFETYNAVINPGDTYTCSDGSSGCNGQSGDQFTPTSYGMVAGTDAAGLPQYLVLRLDQIKNNQIHQPVRFTLGRGLIQAASSGTPNVWPATGSNGWGSANTLPYGARLRLHSSFNVSSYPPYVQNILNAFKQYGIILADVGTNAALQVDSDVWRDPSVISAVQQATSAVHFSDFEVVDESSLQLAAGSYAVNANSPYVTPVGSAQVMATDATNSQSSVIQPIALQGVGVGLQNPEVSALVTGTSYSYNFATQAWATGTTDQSLIWTLASGPGSVTQSGVYTVPASVSGITQVELTATAAADPNASATQYILLYPTSSDGAFRTVIGSSTPMTDGKGFVWQPTAALETGVMIQLGADSPSWTNLSGNPEQNVWQAVAYTYGSDMYMHFIAPNGHYKMRFLFGAAWNGAYPSGTYNPAWHAPLFIRVNGQNDANWYEWDSHTSYAYGQAWQMFVPVNITTGVIDAWFGGVNPDFDNYTSGPEVSAIEFIPDRSAAHITIDTGMEAFDPSGNSIGKPLSVSAGKTAQLYAVGWYMSNSVTWSLVSGPGSINSSTGLYTAPATAPGSAQTVVVKATSTVNSGLQATATLVVP